MDMQAIGALGRPAVLPCSGCVDARGRIVTVKVGVLRAAQAQGNLHRTAALDPRRIDLATARHQIAPGTTRLVS
jgi:hypothetical protein